MSTGIALHKSAGVSGSRAPDEGVPHGSVRSRAKICRNRNDWCLMDVVMDCVIAFYAKFCCPPFGNSPSI
jgi:hypothetical protein